MALTKVEAAKLTNDLLLRGVIDTVVKESSVLPAAAVHGRVGNGGDVQPGGDDAGRFLL